MSTRLETIYRRQLRRKRRAAGLCTSCGKAPPRAHCGTCQSCAERAKERRA